MGSGNETASGFVVCLCDCPSGGHAVSSAVIRAVSWVMRACCSWIALTRVGINVSWLMFLYSIPSPPGSDVLTHSGNTVSNS